MPERGAEGGTSTTAVALSRDADRLAPLTDAGWQPLPTDQARVWTDDWHTALVPLWHRLSR